MLLQRTRIWLVVLATLLGAAASARAQFPPYREEPPPASEPTHHQELQPFGPADLGDIKDAQIWQPFVNNDQDRFPQGAYGPYFKYERFYWAIHQPQFAFVGNNEADAIALGLNENTNEFIKANFVWGNRFDIGYRLCDNTGWATSIVKSNMEFAGRQDVTSTTSVGFDDETGVLPLNATQAVANTFLIIQGIPPFPVPEPAFESISYQPLTLQNSSRFAGVDLLRTWRYEPGHHGGVWEFGIGPRFFQFHDRFDAEGTTNALLPALFGIGLITLPQAPPNTVSGAIRVSAPPAPNFWDLGIDNNVVGPELGARWSLKRERWTVSTDFRALIGANFQTGRLAGALGQGYTTDTVRLDTGAILPNTHTQTGVLGSALFTFNSAANTVTFAPMGELRVDASYNVTRNVSLEVGYTGILLSGIGRASDRIIYSVPNMGILDGADKQHVYVNGVNFGFNVNY
jgi:hypothetical protein